jgi:hypothetical protein
MDAVMLLAAVMSLGCIQHLPLHTSARLLQAAMLASQNSMHTILLHTVMQIMMTS